MVIQPFHSGIPIAPVKQAPLKAKESVLPQDSLVSSLPAKPLTYGFQPTAPAEVDFPPAQIEFHSSDHELSRKTLGASGEPSLQVPLHATHLRHIQMGLDAMEKLSPGLQGRLDKLLHPDIEPERKSKQLAIGERQAALYVEHGRLISMPDEKLNSAQLKQKKQIQGQLEGLQQQYEALGKELEQCEKRQLAEAAHLAKVFLHDWRSQGPEKDLSVATVVRESAKNRLKEDKISPEDLKSWNNHFHHQVGLATPGEVKFHYSGGRAHYDHQLDSVNVGDKLSRRLVLHELAHRLEFKHPELAMASRSWVQARNQKGGFPNEPIKLQDLNPTGKYEDDEVAFDDSFISKYVGKSYASGATEVLSVGLEHFADPKLFVQLYRQDPEHLFLVLGSLETVRGKNW